MRPVDDPWAGFNPSMKGAVMNTMAVYRFNYK